MRKYQHSFSDYYGVNRQINSIYGYTSDNIKDIDFTRFAYHFTTSVHEIKNIIDYNERFRSIEETTILCGHLAEIEINFTEKQKWYAEMMYDGALLPQEDN